jgi:hypothetical protein
MNLKASIVIMSHLSDAQEPIEKELANHHINFAKFLVMKYKDTSVEINPDEDYVEYLRKHSSKTFLERNNIKPVKHSPDQSV